MAKNERKIFQFKITLEDVMPKVWRRIQIPENYSFWDLHVAIQDAMGWSDSHLHQFEVDDLKNGEKKTFGIPDGNLEDELDVSADWKSKIADYFSKDNKTARYVYDFGDDWIHKVTLEKIVPTEKGVKYPSCIDGARACPPENCGGPYGYAEFLEAVADPHHEEHKRMTGWIGGKWDSEAFDPKEVRFDDPAKRWKNAFK